MWTRGLLPVLFFFSYVTSLLHCTISSHYPPNAPCFFFFHSPSLCLGNLRVSVHPLGNDMWFLCEQHKDSDAAAALTKRCYQPSPVQHQVFRKGPWSTDKHMTKHLQVEHLPVTVLSLFLYLMSAAKELSMPILHVMHSYICITEKQLHMLCKSILSTTFKWYILSF